MPTDNDKNNGGSNNEIYKILQKLTLVFALIFMLHEWEEGVYPGGFAETFLPKIFGDELPNIDLKLLSRESRLLTGTLLLFLTMVPYFGHHYSWTLLLCVYLGVFEGFTHVASIKIFKLQYR